MTTTTSAVTTMISLTQFAKLLGVSRRSIHRWKHDALTNGEWFPAETVVAQARLITLTDAIKFARLHNRALNAS